MRDLLKTLLLVVGGLAVMGNPALAQSAWPQQSVKFVVPQPPGGGLDTLARILASRLSEMWGQQVIVENRAGGSSIIGTEAVARATDGHTLLVANDSALTFNPHLFATLSYDPVKDFEPIIHLLSLNQLLLAGPAVEAKTLAELIAAAKKAPGTISYASYGAGSQAQIASEILKKKAGIDLLHVPYRGLQPAMAAAIAGEVGLTWSGAASSRPQVLAGRLKPLAIGGERRLPLMPDVPTFKELGFPEVDSTAWFGILAPAKTPSAVIERVYADVSKIMSDPAMQEREVTAKGYEWVGSGPAKFRQYIVTELKARGETVRLSGAKVE
jgi:tripartite-type tricarboxylate transporter receptor subunit TctC